MFVERFCGSWMDHPFWQKSFLIEDDVAYQAILSSSIVELFIDTAKGLDVLSVRLASEEQTEVVIPESPPLVPEKEFVARAAEPATSMDVELGRAAKVIKKSKQAVVLMFQEARLGNAVNLESMESLVDDITASVMRNSGALIGLVRLKSKDDYSYMHSIAVCALMIALAKQLNLSEREIRDAGLAGLLHDIGKMTLPMDILNKPGKLTAAEFDIVKQHPLSGYKLLLKNKETNKAVLDVCLHHHEKMDGSGYPDKYSGNQISLMARMGAVCDVYDAITSNRPYKVGWCPSESIKKMAEWTKGHFDEVVFGAFVKSIGIYPVGSLVRMGSGRIGVVIEQNTKSLLLPKVKVFFSSKSISYIAPCIVDMASPGEQDKIVSREDADKWGLKNVDQYWAGDAML